MKRLKNKWVISIFVIIIVIGGVLMTQRKTPFDIFLTKDYTKATKEEQIAYLKQHEAEMTDYVKSQNLKVTNVQWDWHSLETKIGGGPIESEKWIQISGYFNNIKNSSIVVMLGMTDNDVPIIKTISSSQSLRINGEIYE